MPCLFAMMPLAGAVVLVQPAVPTPVVSRASVKMQYGGGYGAQVQQGYGQMGQQQGYGGQMGQMGQQRPSAVANPEAWYIFPRDGASSMLQNDYQVLNGQQQVLGRYDLLGNNRGRPDQQGISPEQCCVQVAPDGSCCTLYALGQTPTGWRTRPDEPWNWLQPGQSVQLSHHNKITMDVNYPDQAVYKLADGKQANENGPCWQYVSQYQQGGGQQGGGQQQGYGQQQGNGQQQGYGQQQQGGYYR